MKTVVPHKPGLKKWLQEQNISVSGPVSRVISVKRIHAEGEEYFIAYLYDNFVDYMENIDILCAVNEEQLRKDLKEIYNINYLSKRTFDNFHKWFVKIQNRSLSPDEKQIIRQKFDN